MFFWLTTLVYSSCLWFDTLDNHHPVQKNNRTAPKSVNVKRHPHVCLSSNLSLLRFAFAFTLILGNTCATLRFVQPMLPWDQRSSVYAIRGLSPRVGPPEVDDPVARLQLRHHVVAHPKLRHLLASVKRKGSDDVNTAPSDTEAQGRIHAAVVGGQQKAVEGALHLLNTRGLRVQKD